MGCHPPVEIVRSQGGSVFQEVAAGLILWDNMQLTGSPWSFPMSVWYDAWQGRPGCNGLGFGDGIGCAPTLGSFGHASEGAQPGR